MRLSLQTDYALRTLIYLAGRQRRATVDEIAGFYRISSHHVAKVVNQLARLGYVRSIRGIGGGLELGRAAETVPIGEVVQAFEGSLHLLDCVGMDNVCVIQPNCRLRRVLAEAERLQLEYLNSVRLSDVVRPGRDLAEFKLISIDATRPVSPTHSRKAPKSQARKVSKNATTSKE